MLESMHKLQLQVSLINLQQYEVAIRETAYQYMHVVFCCDSFHR